MAEFKNLAVRAPLELAHAVESLTARRRAEKPFDLVSIGQVMRELLARGLESVAAEDAASRQREA